MDGQNNPGDMEEKVKKKKKCKLSMSKATVLLQEKARR